MPLQSYYWFSLCYILLLTSCHRTQEPETLFTKLPPSHTGVTFSNMLEYSNTLNPYTHHNFYNGGGVAAGDLNNDGLPDLVFTGNQVGNKIYINKGNLQFEDVSERARISTQGLWYTGVTLVDINADGWLDIYLCRAEDFMVGWQGNELYINNGNLTFSEKAGQYGLSFAGFSTHSVFFDLDNDSDLDCYLLNSTRGSSSGKFYPSVEKRKVMAQDASKLYVNENDHFTDITSKSGIYGNRLELGLGVTASDINKDGWCDIYVSNDFFERDYLYLNNHNKTFSECLDKYIQEISMFSMGADIADINNDGYADIYVTDMLPENEGRVKSKTNFETWEKYQYTVNSGYHHQFVRNVLQLNRGPFARTGTDSAEYFFSEIGRLAGVHATDWSWGALIADLNNDGHKDIFVSNGMFKDVTDQDFIQFMANDSAAGKLSWKSIIDMIPSEPVTNFVFENNGNLTFSQKIAEWGFEEPTFSNGSAYADLDNDGDLDIIINNVNSPAGIYRNNSSKLLAENHWLKISLEGEGKNKFGIGAKVTAYFNNTLCYLEQYPGRGYQSCIDYTLHVGLGRAKVIDSVRIDWPDGRTQILKKIKSNQTIIVKQNNANSMQVPGRKFTHPQFEPANVMGLNFLHKEDSTVDFNNDKLLYSMLSTSGPKADVADVNGDGRDDIYICGAKGQPGILFIQEFSGKFTSKRNKAFEEDEDFEDTDCKFFDADGDGDKDLFVSSGGNTYPAGSSFLMNRIYFNDGKGTFTHQRNLASSTLENIGTVCAIDFDQDKDIDLFTGGRSKAGAYGFLCDGHLLANDGRGSFIDVTDSLAPDLRNAGMITCSKWVDYDNDKKPDLVVAGEYMPMKIFHNEGGTLTESTAEAGLTKSNGWWNCLEVSDVNNDGFPDLVAGNHGLNSRFKATEEKPITLRSGDFDKNGIVEQIVCVYNGEKQYPMVLRHDLVALLPSLKKKFLKYSDYKEKTIEEIFSENQLQHSVKQDAYQMQSCVFINNQRGGFDIKPLPIEAQFSPVHAILVYDFDADGNKDILLGGNFYQCKPEAGIHNGTYGVHLKGDGKGNFTAVTLGESGFFVKGAIRDLKLLNVKGKNVIVATKNNDTIEKFNVSFR